MAGWDGDARLRRPSGSTLAGKWRVATADGARERAAENDAVDNFVWREVGRSELTIGEAPALADVSAVRELLLSEPVVWEHSNRGIGDEEMTARGTSTGRRFASAVRFRSSEGDKAMPQFTSVRMRDLRKLVFVADLAVIELAQR